MHASSMAGKPISAIAVIISDRFNANRLWLKRDNSILPRSYTESFLKMCEVFLWVAVSYLPIATYLKTFTDAGESVILPEEISPSLGLTRSGSSKVL